MLVEPSPSAAWSLLLLLFGFRFTDRLIAFQGLVVIVVGVVLLFCDDGVRR